MPANPEPYEVVQPDGTVILVQLRGDERFAWEEDIDGFTVVRDGAWYKYGEQIADGSVAATDLVVGHVDPVVEGLSRHVMPTYEHVIANNRIARAESLARSNPSPIRAAPASLKNMVIMLRFSDHVLRPVPSNEDIDVLFNSVGGDPDLAPTGSVRDVYIENSYGLTVIDSTVYGWVNLPQTEAYYANGSSALGEDSRLNEALLWALNEVDETVDFSEFDVEGDNFIDGIAFIHSGYAAEFGGTDQYGAPMESRIWSHKYRVIDPSQEDDIWKSNEGVRVLPYHISPGVWSTAGSEIGRIGVIAHETGHFLGLPDLYDTDGGGFGEPGQGIGSWGMMANSWGFDGSQLYPPHFSAWSKIMLGWVTPIEISDGVRVTAPAVETSPVIYKVTDNYNIDEYLLIENRQPIGFDARIPEGGLAVYHIDDAAGFNTQGYPGQGSWPGNGKHYRVALVQADGLFELEKNENQGDGGDLFRLGGVFELKPGPDPEDPQAEDIEPNTDAYGVTGEVHRTFHQITALSVPGEEMDFALSDPRLITFDVIPDATYTTYLPVGKTSNECFDFTIIPFTLVNYSISFTGPWLTASPPGGIILDSNNVDVQVCLNDNVALLEPGRYPILIIFRDDSAQKSLHVLFRLIVAPPEVIYDFDMSTDPGWTTEGGWEYGVPTGGGNTNGDPDSGFTGPNVYGYNLDGNYENNLPETSLTTTAIDCTGMDSVSLSYWRWLGVEPSIYDSAKVQVSNDGDTWHDIWVHEGGLIANGEWIFEEFDISEFADDQPEVYVRWVMGPTDEFAVEPGWNIDDIKITAVQKELEFVYVDFAAPPNGIGTQNAPYDTLAKALARTIPEGGSEIIFNGSSAVTVTSEVFTFEFPLILSATGGPVEIGR